MKDVICAGCEKGSPEAISFNGKYSEFRVHWFCKIYDKLAMNAVNSYSHMSNRLTIEITCCLNDTLVKPLNSVIESISKAVDNIQTSITKFLEHRVVPRDESNKTVDSPISKKSVASLATSLFNEQKEREKRELNLVVHNLPESNATESAASKRDDIHQVTSVLNDTLNILC